MGTNPYPCLWLSSTWFWISSSCSNSIPTQHPWIFICWSCSQSSTNTWTNRSNATTTCFIHPIIPCLKRALSKKWLDFFSCGMEKECFSFSFYKLTSCPFLRSPLQSQLIDLIFLSFYFFTSIFIRPRPFNRLFFLHSYLFVSSSLYMSRVYLCVLSHCLSFTMYVRVPLFICLVLVYLSSLYTVFLLLFFRLFLWVLLRLDYKRMIQHTPPSQIHMSI